VEEKRRTVEEALEPGASAAPVANVVNANQLFGWRRLYLKGQLEPKIGKCLPFRSHKVSPALFQKPKGPVALGWPLRYSRSGEVIDTNNLDALGEIIAVLAKVW